MSAELRCLTAGCSSAQDPDVPDVLQPHHVSGKLRGRQKTQHIHHSGIWPRCAVSPAGFPCHSGRLSPRCCTYSYTFHYRRIEWPHPSLSDSLSSFSLSNWCWMLFTWMTNLYWCSCASSASFFLLMYASSRVQWSFLHVRIFLCPLPFMFGSCPFCLLHDFNSLTNISHRKYCINVVSQNMLLPLHTVTNRRRPLNISREQLWEMEKPLLEGLQN